MNMIGLNGGTYTWRITDPQLIASMLNSDYKQVFESDIFEIAHLQWQLSMYPNDSEPKWKGSFCIRLKAINIPQMIDKVIFFRQFRILETSTSSSWVSQISTNDETAGANSMLYPCQATQLKQISIQLQILIHSITMKHQNICMISNIPSNTNSIQFPFKQRLTYCAPKPSTNYFTLPYNQHNSDIQGGNGFYWLLKSYPNGITEKAKNYYSIYLQFVYCSFKFSQVQVKFSIQCTENDRQKQRTFTFSIENGMSNGWIKFMTCKEADLLNSITFNVNIEILNGKVKKDNVLEVTDALYITQMLSKFKCENINALVLRGEEKRLVSTQMNSLASVINELKNQMNNLSNRVQYVEDERKNNDLNGMNYIREELLEIKEKMRQFEWFDDIKIEEKEGSDKLEVRKWLSNVVKLPQYFDILIHSGFEDMDIIADITMDDLNKLNINKLGHKKKLIKAIKNIKNKNKSKMIITPRWGTQSAISNYNANARYYNSCLKNINHKKYLNISSIWNYNTVCISDVMLYQQQYVRCGVGVEVSHESLYVLFSKYVSDMITVNDVSGLYDPSGLNTRQ